MQDLPRLAHETGYSVKALAAKCGVSVRAFELYSSAALREPPRRWLKRLRMEKAVELLRDGSNVTETAHYLGYKDRSHFSREFKKYYGVPPKPFALRPSNQQTASFAHSAT